MASKRNQMPNEPARKPLDRIDRRIVGALQNNARLSNKELAAQIGLAPSSCLQRVRRLIANDVLRGFHADVAPWVLGIEMEAMIAVRLRQHTRSDVDALRAHLLALPEVVAVYHVAGPDDFLIHVAVADAAHLRDFALDALTSRPEIAHLQTALMFDAVRARRLPDYVERGVPEPPRTRAAARALPRKPSKKRSG